MALQDLTPQLRTRLSRVERAVGFFVSIATLLLIAGFAYYIWHTAQRKGWFKTKIQYSTSLQNAAGLVPGQPVKLMGFDVGELTQVIPNDPGEYYGVTIYFNVKEPYYGYIWMDSKVRVAPADFLGNRNLEIVKGLNGTPTVNRDAGGTTWVLDTDAVRDEFKKLQRRLKEENPYYTDHAIKVDATNDLYQAIKEQSVSFYVNAAKAKPYWIEPLESPALTERLETLVNAVETALPDVLALTNKLNAVLTNATDATANLNLVLLDTRPALSNIAVITENLKDPKGSLGEWLLPTNLNAQVQSTLTNAESTLKAAEDTLRTANVTLSNTDTNVTLLISNINLSLINLANLTSNLNSQVQVNTNILTEVSDAIVHADELVQGLKRHWLLRSAFRTNKNEKADKPEPLKRPQAPPTRR